MQEWDPSEIAQSEGVDRLTATPANSFKELGDVLAAYAEDDFEPLKATENFAADLAIELEEL